jgi:hypothetical protein
MRKVLLTGAIVLSSLCLFAQHGGQNNNNQDNEVVGTVSCPVCTPNGAQKLDLLCARTCLDKKNSASGNNLNATGNGGSSSKTTSSGNSANDPDSRPSNASSVPNAVPDPADNKGPNPPKATDNSINLIIIEDGDYRTIAIDNPEAIKRYVAHRISVTGYWINKSHFHVVSVRIL